MDQGLCPNVERSWRWCPVCFVTCLIHSLWLYWSEKLEFSFNTRQNTMWKLNNSIWKCFTFFKIRFSYCLICFSKKHRLIAENWVTSQERCRPVLHVCTLVRRRPRPPFNDGGNAQSPGSVSPRRQAPGPSGEQFRSCAGKKEMQPCIGKCKLCNLKPGKLLN